MSKMQKRHIEIDMEGVFFDPDGTVRVVILVKNAKGQHNVVEARMRKDEAGDYKFDPNIRNNMLHAIYSISGMAHKYKPKKAEREMGWLVDDAERGASLEVKTIPRNVMIDQLGALV